MSHLLVLSLVLLVTQICVQATTTFPPTSITSQYRQTKSVHFMNVDAGNSSPLTGSLAMQPTTFGTHFPVTSTVAGVPSFSGELALPHSSDDPLGCRDPTLRMADDTNATFVGKVLLIRRGWCAFGLKGRAGQVARAAGVIIYGCPVTAPTLCAPGLQQPVVAVTQVGIPVVYIQSADGEALVSYVQARNTAILAGSGSIPQPLTMQVASTGALVPSELSALLAITTKSTMTQDTSTSSYGGLRPWNITTFSSTSVSSDPCLIRIAGIWCENGHVVEIYLAGMKWTSLLADGSIPAEIGALSQLRYLSMASNMFRGAVPPEMCQLTKLQELYLQLQVTGNYDGLTSLPACFSTLSSLNTLYVFNNQITSSIPDLKNSAIAWLDASNNYISSLPASFPTWSNMNSFSASNNRISVLPSLASFSKLTSFKMSGNLMTATITTTSFDNLTTLITLDLSNNRLSGVLPDLKGCSQLTSLILSSNKLSSVIPLVWPNAIPNLQILKLSHNAILSPTIILAAMLYLQTIDLSWNNITAYTGDPTQTDDAGAMIGSMIGPSVVTINLSHNNISGRYGNNWLQIAKQLKTMDISYNGFTSLPTDIFTLTLTSLDASNNQITTWGATTTTPSTNFVYLSLINNPGLIAASLPTWMKADVQMVTNPGSVFQCPRIYNPDNIMMTIQVDAQFTQYKGCQCVPGRFGAPPLCYTVPQTSTLALDGSFTSSSIGTDFAAVVTANSNRTEPSGSAPNASMVDRSFSDAWYGNQRLTLGISTTFVVDLRPSSQPIRFITLHVHINIALFDSNDMLVIYEGDDYPNSPFVTIAQGNLPIPESDVRIQKGYAQTAEYQTLYGPKLASMGSQVALWEVIILGSLATLSFDSRDTEGRHFFATYSYSYACEELGVGYWYDEEQIKCRPPLEIYKVASGIRAAVFGVSGLAIAFVAIVSVIVITHFDTPVIRASSRPFLLLTLLFLGMMSLGSLLYAAIPDESSLGKAVCNGRVWLAAFPLTGILAVLLAKTNRISNIFTMTKLTTVRHVKDQELGMIVGGMLSVTSIMLIIYSGVPLNSPRVAEGTSTYANKLISSCHNTAGFAPWIAILLVYIFVLMIAAAVLAFKARDVPSRFNESTHIMNALFLLIFFGALIVPLDIFIQDSPDASVLIQGIGQSLLVITFTGVIFLPKLYVLFAKDSPPAEHSTILSIHTPQQTVARGSLSKQKSAGGATEDGTGRRFSNDLSVRRGSTVNNPLLNKNHRSSISAMGTPAPSTQQQYLLDMSTLNSEEASEYQAHLHAATLEFKLLLAKKTAATAPSGNSLTPRRVRQDELEASILTTAVPFFTTVPVLDAAALATPIAPNDIALINRVADESSIELDV